MAERRVVGSLDPRLSAAERRRLSEEARAEVLGNHSAFGHWFWCRPSAEPVPTVLGVMDAPELGRRGICCSGGGIRSASFNLGALQALQAKPHRILQTSDYLAAVSGGAYMAAGFAMVAKVDGPDDSDPELVNDDAPPFHPGSPEEQYLRNRSNYMARGVVGKTRLVSRVGLGVLVNLLFLGTLTLLLGWALGVLYGEFLFTGLTNINGKADTGTWATIALAVFGAATVLGLFATLFRVEREAKTRFLQGWAGRLLVVALVVAVIFVALPELVEWLRHTGKEGGEAKGTKSGAATLVATLGGTSAVGLLAGTLLQLRAKLRDQRVLGQAVEAGKKSVTGYISTKLWPRMRAAVQLVVIAAVGPALLGGIFVVSVLASLIDQGDQPWLPLAVAAAVFLLLYSLGEVTTWSLHPFYRRRLCTAFALKRVPVEGQPAAVERDNDVVIRLSESGVEPVPSGQKQREWPELLVCAAANVSDPGATPPGRAVTSFAFSPNMIGGPLIGMIDTTDFEKALEYRLSDFALPAAVAISGAALAPSMGKMTNWPLRFLLTLANARLGVWVPNPRRIEEFANTGRSKLWRLHDSRPRASLLFRELLGQNHADARFLYVTDGGHYENLGLVELLRRGCTEVFCFDASGGADVQELGDAVALARTELQVEIEFDIDPAKLVPDSKTGIAERHLVTGKIQYPDGPEGRLIYVRSVLTEGAPHDITAYHDLDPEFPHNSTGDQLYTDQRFEAYRKLGHRAGRDAVDVLHGMSSAEVAAR